jgi:hypothetical protein
MLLENIPPVSPPPGSAPPVRWVRRRSQGGDFLSRLKLHIVEGFLMSEG